MLIGAKDMSETGLIRINKDLWAKLQKAVADSDLSIKDLVEWVLSNVDLDEYAKELSSKVESDEESAEEEAEQGAEEEDNDDEEEESEEADDEEENFGKYS
jgi:hypothetical protein